MKIVKQYYIVYQVAGQYNSGANIYNSCHIEAYFEDKWSLSEKVIKLLDGIAKNHNEREKERNQMFSKEITGNNIVIISSTQLN